MYRFQAKEKKLNDEFVRCLEVEKMAVLRATNILGPARSTSPEGRTAGFSTEVDGQAAEVEEPPEDYYDEAHAMLQLGVGGVDRYVRLFSMLAEKAVDPCNARDDDPTQGVRPCVCLQLP